MDMGLCLFFHPSLSFSLLPFSPYSQFPCSAPFILFLPSSVLLQEDRGKGGSISDELSRISCSSGDGMAKVWLWRAVTWPLAHLSTLFGLAQEARSHRAAGRLELKMAFIRLFVRTLCCLTACVVWTEHCCGSSTLADSRIWDGSLLQQCLYSLIIRQCED